ncbi:glucose PTS transporter transcription antiterminator GlcT [Shouchella shacheensis]|uniref:glucose PTS transporter transcription antiterminator GlcT n=1 Tax=Shouchella shacheensis TaxID=1649580 RepID=UPI0007402541|nr:transcription antiterminator [Shouchella shacheensis]
MAKVKVTKSLNNNVLIGNHSTFGEVVLIGRGIGFNRKKGDWINQQEVEKLFVLKDEKEQESYLKLLPYMEQPLVELTIKAIDLIRRTTDQPLHEHIHVGLMDHLSFALTRIEKGMTMKNPFLAETKVLYPSEYAIAENVGALIEEETGVSLPEGEIGFITLHIHSAMQNKDLHDVNSHSRLITQLIELIEAQLDFNMDKDGADFMRLVRHLRFTIERVDKGEKVEEPIAITKLLKQEYPVCYNLSWKLIKVMQQTLKKPVFDAEAVYLTMHLQRIGQKLK